MCDLLLNKLRAHRDGYGVQPVVFFIWSWSLIFASLIRVSPQWYFHYYLNGCIF